jgi:geranylgeranyl pyrophosphate synthase
MDIMKHLDERKREIDSAIEAVLPRRIDHAYAARAFGKPRYAHDIESLTKALADPAWDLLDRGGKRWRPGLFLLIVDMLGGDSRRLAPFSAIPELVHNGTLMVDDVEDLGELRRGKPCTHKLFGQDVAINAGNYLYFIPLLSLIESRGIDDRTKNRCYEAYAQEMINVSAGQAMDIWWHRGGKQDISEEQYLQMCAFKTGTLARLAARLAVILTGGSHELEAKLGGLAESLGVGFQIQDDVLSTSRGEFSKRKGFGDDITEGKRSLPVIHALNHASSQERQELLAILDSHTRDHKKLERALDIIENAGSPAYARKVAEGLITKAWRDCEPCLPGNEAKRSLESLMRFAVSRSI